MLLCCLVDWTKANKKSCNPKTFTYYTSMWAGCNISALDSNTIWSRAQFPQKTWPLIHLCTLAYIESLIILTLNSLFGTNLCADISKGKYSCKKRKAKQRDQSAADLVTYCDLINSCFSVSDDIRSPRQALIVHSVRHKVNGAFNNYLC